MKAKKIIIPVVVIAALGAAGAGIAAAINGSAVPEFTGASLAEQKETLMNYISVTGTVESRNCSKVCSTLSYPVEKINFEVGDFVRKGDVLCTLDTDSLQDQILQQQAAVDSRNVTAQYQLTEAEKNYNNALSEYNAGNNQSIAAAKQSLSQAESALSKAQSDYDNAVEMSGKDKNTQLRSAELALRNAEDDLKTAQKNLEKAKKEAGDEDYYAIRELKKALDDAEKTLNLPITMNKEAQAACDRYREASEAYYEFIYITNGEGDASAYLAEMNAAEKEWNVYTEKYKLENAKKAYSEAAEAYEKAKADIDKGHNSAVESAENVVDAAKKSVESAKLQIQSIKDNTSDGIKSYKSALTAAQSAYEMAKENLSLAEKSVDAQLSSLKFAAERERTVSGLNDSSLIALESLKEQLDEAVIRSPADGMITFIGAEEGGEVPRGTLFTVEDKDNLKITANLREFDVTNVETGMKVIITSEAASGEEYEGVLTKIAPTAQKSADGSDAGTALFAIEVAVTSKDTKLMIGMTAKMRIVLEEKEDVLTVPYDCIGEEENGQTYVFIAEKGETGYIAKKVNVTVGMETDFLAEITGSGISAGTVVLLNTADIEDGQTVNIDEVDLGLAEPVESEKK